MEFEIFKNERPGRESAEHSGGSGKKSNIKKLLKNKKFLILVWIVAVVAIIFMLRRNRTYSTGLTALAVQPTAGNISDSDANTAYTTSMIETMHDSYESKMYEMQNGFESTMSAMETTYLDKIDSIQSAYAESETNLLNQIDRLISENDDLKTRVQSSSVAIERMADVDTMKNNSDMWFFTESESEKNALNQKNKAIASKWGWTYSDGDWFDEDGNKLYSTATQNAVVNSQNPVPAKVESSSSSSSSTSSRSSGSSEYIPRGNRGSTSSGVNNTGHAQKAGNTEIADGSAYVIQWG